MHGAWILHGRCEAYQAIKAIKALKAINTQVQHNGTLCVILPESSFPPVTMSTIAMQSSTCTAQQPGQAREGSQRIRSSSSKLQAPSFKLQRNPNETTHNCCRLLQLSRVHTRVPCDGLSTTKKRTYPWRCYYLMELTVPRLQCLPYFEYEYARLLILEALQPTVSTVKHFSCEHDTTRHQVTSG